MVLHTPSMLDKDDMDGAASRRQTAPDEGRRSGPLIDSLFFHSSMDETCQLEPLYH